MCIFGSNLVVSTDLGPTLNAVLDLILVAKPLLSQQNWVHFCMQFGSSFEVSADLDPILSAVLDLILVAIIGSIFAESAKLGPSLGVVLDLILQCQRN